MNPSSAPIRLPDDVQHALTRTAQQTGTPQEMIVERAVRAYLQQLDEAWLREEARCQSLLARHEDLDDDAWEENADTSGWIA